MGKLLTSVAEALGAREDQLMLILLLVLSVPLSSYIVNLEGRAKHLYSLVISWVFLWPLLGLKWGYVQLLGQALLSYGLCQLGARRLAHRPWPWMVFAAAMGHLIVVHIRRYRSSSAEAGEIEVSQMMMVLIQRTTLFAWTSYDSAQKTAKAAADSGTKPAQARLPLLSYLGYCFFLPVFLAGPGIDYKSYVERTSLPLPPGRSQAAFKKLILGLTFIVLWSTLTSHFAYTKILEDAFLELHWSVKLFFINAAGFMARTKYYGVWLLAEAACISSGIGRTLPVVDGSVAPWSHAANVDIPSIEFAENWRQLLSSWNAWTNHWLRETVYIRVAKPGRKPGFKSTMVTFVVSALWHGVDVCYLATFVLGSFIQSLAKQMRRHVRPLVAVAAVAPQNESGKPVHDGQGFGKTIYDCAGTIATQCLLNYIVAPFVLLNWDHTITVWSRLWWYGHIFTFAPLLVLQLGGKVVLQDWAASRRMTTEASKRQNSGDAAAEPMLVGSGEDVAEKQDEMSAKVEEKVAATRQKKEL